MKTKKLSPRAKRIAELEAQVVELKATNELLTATNRKDIENAAHARTEYEALVKRLRQRIDSLKWGIHKWFSISQRVRNAFLVKFIVDDEKTSTQVEHELYIKETVQRRLAIHELVSAGPDEPLLAYHEEDNSRSTAGHYGSFDNGCSVAPDSNRKADTYFSGDILTLTKR